MHEFWTIPTANIICTRAHNYTHIIDGEHGNTNIWSCGCCFCCCCLISLSPESAHPLFFLTIGLPKYTLMLDKGSYDAAQCCLAR